MRCHSAGPPDFNAKEVVTIEACSQEEAVIRPPLLRLSRAVFRRTIEMEV
jgi:ribosomal protein S14